MFKLPAALGLELVSQRCPECQGSPERALSSSDCAWLGHLRPGGGMGWGGGTCGYLEYTLPVLL